MVNSAPSDHHQDAHAGATATDLSIFSGVGPKLEDFLGGGCTSTSTAVATSTADVITTASATPMSLAHFSSSTSTDPLAVSENNEIYDSELKTIAASFLRGFSTTAAATTLQQTKPQTQNHAVGPNETATPKKTVDTFGQRTSIYRGVTR